MAVRREILRRIRKNSKLAGFTLPLQQGKAAFSESACSSQEAVPWALGLSSLPHVSADRAVTESIVRRLEDGSVT